MIHELINESEKAKFAYKFHSECNIEYLKHILFSMWSITKVIEQLYNIKHRNILSLSVPLALLLSHHHLVLKRYEMIKLLSVLMVVGTNPPGHLTL